MARLEPKVITGTPAAFLQGAQLWAVQTAIELLPGVFAGGPRGPTAGQQLRLAEAGYVRQETRGGRFPLVTWLTPSGQVIGNEAARGVAHDLPRAGPTPGINPSAPPTRPPTELDALLRNRTFVPRGGTVTSAPPSDFDRLVIGRTYNPPDLPQRAPTAPPRGGTQGEFAAAAGQSLFELLIRPWLIRRRGVKKRGGLRPRRTQPRTDAVLPPSMPPPTPVQTIPRAPAAPARTVPAVQPAPEMRLPRPVPQSTVTAESYRVPAPATGPIRLPQPRSLPSSVPAPSASAVRRSLLDPLVGLLGLPLLSAPTSRPRPSNFAPPQFPTPSVTAPPQFSSPILRPLTQFQTQPLGSTSHCECGPKPTRTRAKKCTNPIVSKRTRGNLQIITRRLECP